MKGRCLMMWLRSVSLRTAVVAGLMFLAGPVAEASHLADNPKRHKIVYHLTEPGADKAKAVLGNVRNHVKGVGGWRNIEALELVVHGAALKSFLRAGMDPEVRRALEMLQTEGMAFGACGNTIKGLGVTLADLAEGAKELPQGGVVRVMELQDQGYVYIRP
jgi:intracellular sulfur oxidation DsrE/DsrF family protein